MSSSGSGASFRFVTWNVRSLRDDRAVVAATLCRLRPDVVALQEAPRFGLARHSLERLASRAGLRVVAGGAATRGVGLLVGSRVRIVDVRIGRLTRTPKKHRRAVVAARLLIQRTPLVAASTHLGLSASERLRHVNEIASLLDGFAGDATTRLLGLDTNEFPGGDVDAALSSAGRVVEVLAGQPDAAPTYPALAPTARIDQIWASPRVRVLRAGVPRLPALADASDHLPVVADLALPVAPPNPAGWDAASS